ncbi:DUF2336 domain-containing protein [Stappia sp.]|uniref:DUF2336 domain-containing protein n=1 Tax=Stappia sp. TaxID=1870903 RepID=UPI0032D8D55E
MIVQQFLRWVASAPEARRAEATSALARAYLYSDLDADDREAAEAAMILLLDDPSAKVRKALAEALARSADAPREVILALINDLPQIAAPVLRYSPILLDAELVEAATGFADPLPEAIARRAHLAPSVAAAIAEAGGADACFALLTNPTAVVPAASLARIAQRHGATAAIREALMERGDTPIAVRQMLLQQVGDLLRHHPLVRRGLREDRAQAVVADARERATVSLADRAAPQDTQALVAHLVETGQLTTALLLRALCTGNAALFEAALVHLSGLSGHRVREVLAGGRMPAVRALLTRAEIPARTHPLFCAAVEVWREIAVETAHLPETGRTVTLARRVIGSVLERYARMDGVEADDLVVMLRRFSAEIARESARTYVQRQMAA